MDDADKAGEINEAHIDRAIEAARKTTVYIPGPDKCMKCDKKNDQKQEGKALCYSCEEEYQVKYKAGL